MLSTKLVNTRVEVLSGSAVIESNEIPKDNAIELVYKKDSIQLQKQGLYRLDSEPARFVVFEGEAVVTDPSGQLTLRGGKQTKLGGVLMAESFDRKADDQDALYRWSDRRASYVAQANVASAASTGNGLTPAFRIRIWRRLRIWLRFWWYWLGFGGLGTIRHSWVAGCLIRCSECTPSCRTTVSDTAPSAIPITAPTLSAMPPLMAVAVMLTAVAPAESLDCPAAAGSPTSPPIGGYHGLGGQRAILLQRNLWRPCSLVRWRRGRPRLFGRFRRRPRRRDTASESAWITPRSRFLPSVTNGSADPFTAHPWESRYAASAPHPSSSNLRGRNPSYSGSQRAPGSFPAKAARGHSGPEPRATKDALGR